MRRVIIAGAGVAAVECVLTLNELAGPRVGIELLAPAAELLVVATGARSREAVPGAMTFRGPMSAGLVEQVVARVAANPGLRLAFAAPPGVRWLLPLYELALLSAATLHERGVGDPDIVVATAKPGAV